MKKILTILLSATVLTSCSGQEKSISVIAPSEFAQKLEFEKNPQLIDVRTPGEFAGGHIDGAKNIDWNGDDFARQASQLDKSRPVFVYCKIGGRSGQAATRLSKMGYQVYDLKGGIMKWDAEKGTRATGGMSKAEFDKLTSSAPKVLVNFHAVWCAPCKKMEPYMVKLGDEMPSVKVVRLDADKNKGLMSELKTDALPLTMYFENGVQKWSQAGFIGEEELKSKLK